MQKMKKTVPLVAFILSEILIFSYWLFNGYYPFGERSIAWCDMEQQFIPLLLELKQHIKEKSFFLSDSAGGMSFWGVFFFFVSSPLSLLGLAVDNADMIYFVNILTALKMGLSALTMSIYLNYDNKKLDFRFNILLAMMYSFSGYTMMYYQNNMWLDVMYMFPLFMVSFMELMKKGRTTSYILCLSLIVYLNYYISYMVIIFIIISSVVLLFTVCAKEKRKEISFKFIISSLISAMLTAPIWLVSFLQIMESGRGSSEEVNQSEGFFENWIDKLCLLSATGIVLISIILIFKEKRKYSYGVGRYYKIIMLILLFSIFADPINKMWHTGSYQAYPLRYGFIPIFIGIAISGKYLLSLRISEERKKHPFLICTVSVLTYAITVSIISIFYAEHINSYVDILWVSESDAIVILLLAVISLTAYGMIFYYSKRKEITLRVATLFMTVVFICESIFSMNIYMRNAPDVTDRYDYTISLENKIQDNEFYRVKSQKRYFYSNMFAGMNMESTAHYTSLTDKDFIYTMKKMGYSSYWMDISSNGGTLVTDAFLMNKYIAGSLHDAFSEYNLMYFSNLLKIYQNTVVLDGALISDISPDELTDFDKKDRMDISEFMSEKLLKSEDIISKINRFTVENVDYKFNDGIYNISKDSEDREAFIRYTVNTDVETKIYFDIFGNYSTNLTEEYYEACDVYVNGELFEAGYPNKKTNGILNLGTFEEEKVSIEIKLNKNFSVSDFGLYTLDVNEFRESLETTNTAKIEKNGDTITISGTGEGYLYIPFCWNEGYTAKINGEKAEIYECMGSFMAVELEDEEFEITLLFYSDGIILSVIIFAFGVVLLMIYTKKSKQFFVCDKLIKTSYILYLVLVIIAFMVIYFSALTFWII